MTICTPSFFPQIPSYPTIQQIFFTPGQLTLPEASDDLPCPSGPLVGLVSQVSTDPTVPLFALNSYSSSAGPCFPHPEPILSGSDSTRLAASTSHSIEESVYKKKEEFVSSLGVSLRPRFASHSYRGSLKKPWLTEWETFREVKLPACSLCIQTCQLSAYGTGSKRLCLPFWFPLQTEPLSQLPPCPSSPSRKLVSFVLPFLPTKVHF